MAGEDPSYTAWLRTLPCACCSFLAPAEERTVHHHTRGSVEAPELFNGRALRCGRPRGKAQTAHDHWGIPMIHSHHMDFHALRHRFDGWNKRMLRDWQDGKVAFYLREYFGKDNELSF